MSFYRLALGAGVFEQVEERRGAQQPMSANRFPAAILGHMEEEGKVGNQLVDCHQVRRSMMFRGRGPTAKSETRAAATVSISATIRIVSLSSCSKRREP